MHVEVVIATAKVEQGAIKALVASVHTPTIVQPTPFYFSFGRILLIAIF